MTLANKLDPQSEYLAHLWDTIDWQAAEAKLAALQSKLAQAATNFDRQAVIALQDEIVSDLDCRCLAVKKVAHDCNRKSNLLTNSIEPTKREYPLWFTLSCFLPLVRIMHEEGSRTREKESR